MNTAEIQAAQFFVEHAVAHARTLSMPEARLYLRGLLTFAPDQAFAGFVPIRKAYIELAECDDQLQLIASGQLTLDLGGAQ